MDLRPTTRVPAHSTVLINIVPCMLAFQGKRLRRPCYVSRPPAPTFCGARTCAPLHGGNTRTHPSTLPPLPPPLPAEDEGVQMDDLEDGTAAMPLGGRWRHASNHPCAHVAPLPCLPPTHWLPCCACLLCAHRLAHTNPRSPRTHSTRSSVCCLAELPEGAAAAAGIDPQRLLSMQQLDAQVRRCLGSVVVAGSGLPLFLSSLPLPAGLPRGRPHCVCTPQFSSPACPTHTCMHPLCPSPCFACLPADGSRAARRQASHHLPPAHACRR
mgnify:CR=1 FL=1